MEAELTQYLIVCPLIFIGGFVDAIAGGGGLITLPAYLLAGVPAHLALGTNKLSGMMGTSIATGRLWAAGCINVKWAVPGIVMALLGSALGARLALMVPEHWFQLLLAVLLPVIAFFVVFKRTAISAQAGEMPEKRRLLILAAAAFLCGTYDGFYGPGAGTFMLLACSLWARLDVRSANGEVKAMNLASNVAAFVTFMMSGNILWTLGLAAGLFGIAGNYVGAGLVLNQGTKVVRPIIVIVLALLFVKTAWDFLN